MIEMIGIDHNRASVDIRALFAFTKKNAGKAMEKILENKSIQGCIILSTCNRLELWASTKDGEQGEIYDSLCCLKGVNGEDYQKYFVYRREQEAVEHLFYLASGLKSQIIGEDQILTQVKDALALAREHYATDNVLEVLFRMAVTAGKKIKTEVVFTRSNPSVIHRMLEILEEQGYEVAGKTCMVIGNGEMGKLTAQTLQEAGADVTVTVRQYRSGVVNIPKGCKRINYGERMEYLPKCDLVISATASPNVTIREELLADITLSKGLILVDLAVPRDIDPEVGKVAGITLYDMDSFRGEGTSRELTEALEKAESVVRKQMEDFETWYEGRNLIPKIQEIKSEAVKDLNLRIGKIMNNLPVDDNDREELLESIDQAAAKVVNKMIFGLRDSLEKDTFAQCVEGLERLYEES